MNTAIDRYSIYEYNDQDIVLDLCRKVKALRRSCCVSQMEFATLSGVSLASIKRIETGNIKDLNMVTLIRIMRACGVLEGFAELIPNVPESPFLIDQKTGTKRKYCKSAFKSATI